ncbi:hypothetical protein [Brevundimonas sp. SH203]|uniref:hypothetical protein n=1 Tax=Brevundimonas sp. SH203 TaxID=345167 RepID=UPI001F3CA8B3|nr:hypothetical protein [Brevundimonas sp. SH203]
MRQRAQVIPPIAAGAIPQLAPCGGGEPRQGVRRNRRRQAIHGRTDPLRVRPGLIAGAGKFGDPIFQRSVIRRQQTVLDSLKEPIELGLGFRGTFAHLRNVAASLLGPFLPTIQKLFHQGREAVQIEQSGFEMVDDRVVELVHGDS